MGQQFDDPFDVPEWVRIETAFRLGVMKQNGKGHKPKRSPGKKAEDKLDALFSEAVRRRAIERVGGCEKCHRPKFDYQKEDGSVHPAWKQLDCMHCFSRRDKATRWDLDNAAGGCGGCHMWLDAHSMQKEGWFARLLGPSAFDNLRIRNQWSGKKVDVQQLLLDVQQLLLDLGVDVQASLL